MAIEIIERCPLGAECEEVKGDKIYRCKWYSKVEGQNPVTGELISERRCDINWLVMIGIENNKRLHGTAAATEDVRNILHLAAEEQAKLKLEDKG